MGVITYQHRFPLDASEADVTAAVCAEYRANPVWYPGLALTQLVSFYVEPGDATRYDVAIGHDAHRHPHGLYLVSVSGRSAWIPASVTELPHWTYVAEKVRVTSQPGAYAVATYIRCVLRAATSDRYLTGGDVL